MFWKSKNKERIEYLEKRVEMLSTEIGIVRGHSRVLCARHQIAADGSLWPEYMGASAVIESILKHLNMEPDIVPYNDTHVVLKSKD